MLKFSRCLIAAAMACGLFGVFTSFAASTAVERPEGLVDLTSPDASKVTTTSTGDWLVGPGTAFHDDGTYTDLSKRVLKSATAMPYLGDCALTKVEDGRFSLAGVLTKNDATAIKIVLSTTGQEDVVKTLGAATEGVPFKFEVTSDGLLTDAFYKVAVIAENASGTTPPQMMSGSFFFGVTPKVADFKKKINFALSDEAKAALDAGAVDGVPVAVRVSTDIKGFDYADMNVNGTDVIFGAVDGSEITRYSYELEKWDPDGESVFWVKVPSLSAATTISMCYGNNVSVPDNYPTSVWSDYVGVWHMAEESGTVADATGNGLTATPKGTTEQMTSVEGVIGGARINATSAVKNYYSIPSYSGVGGAFTISAFVKATAKNGYHRLFSRKDSYTEAGGFEVENNNGDLTKYTVRGTNNDKSGTITVQNGAIDAWTHFMLAFNGNAVIPYVDGVKGSSIAINAATDNSKPLSIGNNSNGSESSLVGDIDEVRLNRSAVSDDYAKAEYLAMTPGFLVASAAEPVDATAPVFLTPNTTVSAQGEVTVTITVVKGSGSVYVDMGGEKIKIGDIDTEGTFPQVFVANPTIVANKDVLISAYGINANGTEVYKKAACGTMNAAVVVTNTRDAKEDGLFPGIFTVSRPGTAMAQDLIVNLAWSGTAEAGVDYEDNLPAEVTIPAGETAVTVEVTPIVNMAKGFDTTVVCTVTEGPYIAGGTATLTIKNVELDDRFNTWVGGGADDKASTPENWSLGVPVNGQAILFDGRFANPSNKNCDWDIDTSTVASWTQNNGYDGTVTLRTVYPGKSGMEVFTVTGAMTIESGTLTHPQSVVKGDPISDPAAAVADLIANETYRIRIAAGSVSVGVDGKIDAMGKGYYMNNSGDNTMPYPSHGGMFSRTGCKVYGDPKEPIHVGLPYKIASGNYYVGKGGGAIYITATGAVKVDGVISANSSDGSWAENARASGAAGSVYIHAASVSGAGSITADGSNSLEQNNKGVGGRVAIITETPVDRGTFAAISAKVNTLNNKPAQATNFGGAGTVFFKDSTMTNGKLVIAEKSDRNDMSMGVVNRYTFVGTDGDWTFDSVEFAKNSYLVVPSGSELHLPSGLDSISSTATGTASGGVLYEGGIFDIGSNANQIMSGNWILVGWSNLVLNANVTVSGNAAIGVPSMGVVGDNGSSLPLILTSSVTVNGDLTVASDGFLKAVSCGCRKLNQWVSQGVLGHAAHGGRIMAAMNQSITCKSAYDSVFSPCLPGCGIPWPNGQGVGNSGGVMKLVVTGGFTLNGVANASGSPESHHQGGNAGGGSGGAIDITTGTIAGSGSITADGGSYSWMSGPGGRIAVKLTKPGADFSGFTGLIRATGRSRGSHGGAQGSAGTVYLKTGDEADFAGTLRIACPKYDSNDNWNNKTSTTELVSLGYGGDDVADYKKVKVEVRDYGFAAVNTDVTVKSVTLATADAKLDLEGNTLTVDKFEYFANDAINNLAAGEYSFAQLSVIEGLNIVDTSAGQSGKIIVKERVLRGLKLILR